MPTRSKKERMQIIALSAVLVVILVVIAYTQRSAFIPSARPGTVAAPTRAAVTLRAVGELFEDARFTALRNNLGAPLRSETEGNPAPFSPPPVVVPTGATAP